ncbi:hypothetical protein N8I74_11145 [Chitiniphilus purpureus]|uniref:Uncharacterized protein n=1 Tax=Chitiniphilus purpureus TaxID=2981137 RepID=A0ABY6DI22_9NEIS|nr:hypothetical protein [Chitiniphilus sp. CD1]UXY13878.1 hypothetical protein N8I74_11145 [Chitiniphilus sp. CD1]
MSTQKIDVDARGQQLGAMTVAQAIDAGRYVRVPAGAKSVQVTVLDNAGVPSTGSVHVDIHGSLDGIAYRKLYTLPIPDDGEASNIERVDDDCQYYLVAWTAPTGNVSRIVFTVVSGG